MVIVQHKNDSRIGNIHGRFPRLKLDLCIDCDNTKILDDENNKIIENCYF